MNFLFKITFVFIISFSNFALSQDKERNDSLILNINALSFSSLENDIRSINKEDYSEFLRDHIFSQPEFKFASAIQSEKSYLLKGAFRERFPTISARIINDEVLDRNVNDFNSIRKRQDDSFDGIAEINQAIYSGGKVSSQIRYARHESNNSVLRREAITSELISESNDIFLLAMIDSYVYEYSLDLLNELLPFKSKMEERVSSGVVDPVEYAIFVARLNKFQSSIYSLEAKFKTQKANFENNFKKSFIFEGFPKIPILIEPLIFSKQSFEVSLKENLYLSSSENVNLTKSQYRPQFGFQARYTEYDIDKKEKDNDIRGGLYLSIPVFDFGRGRANISASEAKANAAKIDIDIEKKSNDFKESELLAIIESSYKAKEKLQLAYIDTKRQRKIISERILFSGFSPISLIEASENELAQIQILMNTEFELFSSYYKLLHHNQSLINHIGVNF